MQLSTVDVLRRTEETIFVRGWTRHALEDKTGICVLGGLLLVQYGTVDITDPLIWPPDQLWPTGFDSQAALTLVEASGHECFLSRHNDHCCQSMADVMSWIERAINLVENNDQLTLDQEVRIPVLA